MGFILYFLTTLKLINSWQPTSCGPANQITQWGKQVTVDGVSGTPGIFGYPRPQTARDTNTWLNLNGLWSFDYSDNDLPINPSKTLTQEILVPFPVESCLSGIGQTGKYLEYKRTFNDIRTNTNEKLLLHFGAIDWQTRAVYVNNKLVGSHTGGYDSFTFDITNLVTTSNNELYINIYDPSDDGAQPNGKQRISAITKPGGDTYTPSSGIWQTVWLERVSSTYISKIKINTDLTSVSINTTIFGTDLSSTVSISIYDPTSNNLIKTVTGKPNTIINTTISNPKLWSNKTPNLYNCTIVYGNDKIYTYFGLRTFTLKKYQHPGVPGIPPQNGIDRPGDDFDNMPVKLDQPDYNLCWKMCNDTNGCAAWAYGVPNCGGDPNYAQCWLKTSRPGTTSNNCRVSGTTAVAPFTAVKLVLNNEDIFLAGWLDQSFWPDGLYAAPGDDALKFDLQSVLDYGYNVVRLHQKVNPERWYYYADKLGIIILQDAVQKYGGASSNTVPYFQHDIQEMINGKYNHPCIVQWTVFNEGDCWKVFNVSQMVSFVQSLDNTRLVDTDSGGGANSYGLADVNDIHTYPYPGNPIPSATQYGMIGEYGGLGAFVKGHEWVEDKCYAYKTLSNVGEFADTYIELTNMILDNDKYDASCVIYTQITDVELECDGYLNYDRTAKWDANQTKYVVNANQNMINNMP